MNLHISRDGAIVFVLFLLLIALATMMFVHEERQEWFEPFPRRTSYNSRPTGTKGLYLTLKRLGYRVARHQAPLTALPEGKVVFVLAPEVIRAVTSAEWKALTEWVKEGRLAWVALEDPERAAEEQWAVKHSPKDLTPTPAEPLWRGELMAGVRELKVRGGVRLSSESGTSTPSAESHPEGTEAPESKGRGWIGLSPLGEAADFPKALPEVWRASVPLFADQCGPVVRYAAWGEGAFLLVGSPWLFSNEGLDKGDNLTFVLNAVETFVGSRREGLIWFDEYHHGYGKRLTLWQVTPRLVKWGVGQLVLALLLFLWGASRRFTRPLPLSGQERSRAEYLESLATLFQRARATRLVVNQLAETFRQDLATALALPAAASNEELVASVASRDPTLAARLRQTLTDTSRLRAASAPEEAAVLRWAGQLHSLRQEVARIL